VKLSGEPGGFPIFGARPKLFEGLAPFQPRGACYVRNTDKTASEAPDRFAYTTSIGSNSSEIEAFAGKLYPLPAVTHSTLPNRRSWSAAVVELNAHDAAGLLVDHNNRGQNPVCPPVPCKPNRQAQQRQAYCETYFPDSVRLVLVCWVRRAGQLYLRAEGSDTLNRLHFPKADLAHFVMRTWE
jgi:hypothetical protein